ncbi:MAG: tRNA pseudouridine synthase A [Firmicutes bacterium]|nr:tRNA pseudouridine synthase A [Bacillota bacterium]
MNLKLILEYDGTDFCGWQEQMGQRSVQGTVALAIARLTGQNIKLHGAGRTDAGVHALGQVANCVVKTQIPPEKFAKALNPLLPPDVKVLTSEVVAEEWHARFSAKGKLYSYHLLLSDRPRPLLRHRALRVGASFDLEKVEQAISLFLGRHDFAPFAAKGSSAKSTVRTITQAELLRQGEECRLLLAADGFLYHMVRMIVGELVAVARGSVTLEEVAATLATAERRHPPLTAPPQGLYLVEVRY